MAIELNMTNKEIISNLVEQYQSGNTAAYSEIISVLQKPLYSFCLKLLRNHENAADALQDSFLKIHRQLLTLNEPQAALSWMYRITRNTCLDFIRAESRAKKFLNRFTSYFVNTKTEAGSTEGLRLNEIYNALHLLPESTRDILYLSMDEQLTLKDIAQIVGIPEGTVKSKLFYARKKLKGILREVYDEEL
jgi:RNA polymerase sigma-70 factor (ECF subfamily)